MDRLPETRKASDNGLVYVIQRGDSGGSLLFTIPVAQRPAQLEYLLNNRFGANAALERFIAGTV